MNIRTEEQRKAAATTLSSVVEKLEEARRLARTLEKSDEPARSTRGEIRTDG